MVYLILLLSVVVVILFAIIHTLVGAALLVPVMGEMLAFCLDRGCFILLLSGVCLFLLIWILAAG
jgi:hypothetical protein